MTIYQSQDPVRWTVLDDEEDACGAEHRWSGFTCQDEPGHAGEWHRYYRDGSHAKWKDPLGPVVLDRKEP